MRLKFDLPAGRRSIPNPRGPHARGPVRQPRPTTARVVPRRPRYRSSASRRRYHLSSRRDERRTVRTSPQAASNGRMTPTTFRSRRSKTAPERGPRPTAGAAGPAGNGGVLDRPWCAGELHLNCPRCEGREPSRTSARWECRRRRRRRRRPRWSDRGRSWRGSWRSPWCTISPLAVRRRDGRPARGTETYGRIHSMSMRNLATRS